MARRSDRSYLRAWGGASMRSASSLGKHTRRPPSTSFGCARLVTPQYHSQRKPDRVVERRASSEKGLMHRPGQRATTRSTTNVHSPMCLGPPRQDAEELRKGCNTNMCCPQHYSKSMTGSQDAADAPEAFRAISSLQQPCPRPYIRGDVYCVHSWIEQARCK